MDDKPRQQYYSFAHQALPELIFYDPAKLFQALESDGVEFLRYLWRKMGEYAQAEEDGSDLLLEVELSQHEGTTIALVLLPPPERVTEVFFIALVYRENPTFTRYLTLEQAMDLQGRSYTVLGGWDANKIHSNYGSGPVPEKEAFLERVKTDFLLK